MYYSVWLMKYVLQCVVDEVCTIVCG
jgi:hypothetical protein